MSSPGHAAGAVLAPGLTNCNDGALLSLGQQRWNMLPLLLGAEGGSGVLGRGVGGAWDMRESSGGRRPGRRYGSGDLGPADRGDS